MVEGLLDRDGLPQATFRSEVTVLGDKVAPARDTRFAVTQVRAGELTIDAGRNLRTQVVTEGGHGQRITAQQKESLLALCRELESSIGAVGADVPPEEDLLVRITCLYAEAPVGMELTDQTTEPPPVSDEEAVPEQQTDALTSGGEFVDASFRPDFSDEVTDTPSAGECVQAKLLKNASVLEDRTIFVAACRRADNDGIRYLACSLRTHLLWHDATNHCGQNFRQYTGVPQSSCRGRCGPGCSGRSVRPPRCPRHGAYTRDCAEHDFCVQHHPNSPGANEGDRDCGDQFNEAFDDGLYANFNCKGRC